MSISVRERNAEFGVFGGCLDLLFISSPFYFVLAHYDNYVKNARFVAVQYTKSGFYAKNDRAAGLFDKLAGWRDKSDVVKIVTGIRRCGKSTLFKLYQHFKKQ